MFRKVLLIWMALALPVLSSCGLARSAVQMPGRTIKSVGRTLGF